MAGFGSLFGDRPGRRPRVRHRQRTVRSESAAAAEPGRAALLWLTTPWSGGAAPAQVRPGARAAAFGPTGRPVAAVLRHCVPTPCDDNSCPGKWGGRSTQHTHISFDDFQ